MFLFNMISMFMCYFNIVRMKKNNMKCKFMKTCFVEDDDEEFKLKNTIKDILIENIPMFYGENPLYTLIWYDCKDCQELLETMETLHVKHIYINGGYYFYDIENGDKESLKPLLYKEDEFISDELFDIYEEIYSEK